MDIGVTLEIQHAQAFSEWLQINSPNAKDIWVVIYKKASGKQSVTFEELLEVALCYGWIDVFTKSMDSEKYVIRFTPRRKRSTWSEYNMAVVRRLLAEGRMTPTGMAALPDELTPPSHTGTT